MRPRPGDEGRGHETRAQRVVARSPDLATRFAGLQIATSLKDSAPESWAPAEQARSLMGWAQSLTSCRPGSRSDDGAWFTTPRPPGPCSVSAGWAVRCTQATWRTGCRSSGVVGARVSSRPRRSVRRRVGRRARRDVVRAMCTWALSKPGSASHIRKSSSCCHKP